MVEFYLRKYSIDIFSHTALIGFEKAKTLNWIPDFQHIRLSEMFRKKDIKKRNKPTIRLIKKSDGIVLSSYDSLKDFKELTKDNSNKAFVLQFVSQPGIYVENNEEEINKIREKYKIEDDFFFIPNQFWKHKNHLVVFKALKLLKDRGINITLVCTGLLDDFRNKEHGSIIKQYITENQINVFLLGLIDYHEVVLFLKYSIAVINPSFFEGWSSSVEECKSLGKNMILSNIEVHREQNPVNSFYFDPNDVEKLSQLLEFHISNKGKVMKLYTKIEFDESIKRRTEEFAKRYELIVKNVIINNKYL